LEVPHRRRVSAGAQTRPQLARRPRFAPSCSPPTHLRPAAPLSDASRTVLTAGGAGDSPTVDRDLAELWPLDRSVVFLNHGSFGACPREVLRHQAALRDEMETQPVRFLSRELDDRLDAARGALAAFVGADAYGLAFVTNASRGDIAVLRSLTLSPGTQQL